MRTGSRTLYWPKRGLERSEGQIVGYELPGDVLVAVSVIAPEGALEAIQRIPNTSTSPPWSIIGRAEATNGRAKAATNEKHDEVRVILDARRMPLSISSDTRVVLFNPPDPSRLRFLIPRPPPRPPKTKRVEGLKNEMAKQDAYGLASSHQPEEPADGENVGGLEEVIHLVRSFPIYGKWGLREEINDVRRLQSLLSQPPTAKPKAGIASSAGGPPFATRVVRDWTGRLETVPSASVRQLALRLSQLADAPGRYRAAFPPVATNIEERSLHYIQFWNTAWLILNDLIMGYCASKLLLEASPFLSDNLPVWFDRYVISTLTSALGFLNDWPVGLKLNTPLSQFYCDTLGIAIRRWSTFLAPIVASHTSTFCLVLSYSSLGGLTLLFAALRDILSLLALHIYACNAFTAAIFQWQLQSLGGLWNLFRGKRWNVLRRRTDSYAYDVDQLFLGTLLFTVSAFLFPTVITYAGLMFLAKTIVRMVDKMLEMATQALNAFPLFEVLLRLKEPSRLPYGVYFTIKSITSPDLGKGGGEGGRLHVLELHNAAKPISRIFQDSIGS